MKASSMIRILNTLIIAAVLFVCSLSTTQAAPKTKPAAQKPAPVKPTSAMPKAKADSTKAAKPAPKPVTPAVKKTPLKPASVSKAISAKVISVKGTVMRKIANDPKAKWQPVKVGDILSELTVVITGLNSEVVLEFEDRGQTTFRSNTMAGIKELRKTNKHVKTRLGLKYGTIRSKVDSTRGTNDYQIDTPQASLCVRGTSGELFFSLDGGMVLRGRTGTWAVILRNGQRKMRIQGNQGTDGNLTPSGQWARGQLDTRPGDAMGGLTPIEQMVLRNQDGSWRLFGPSGFGNMFRPRRPGSTNPHPSGSDSNNGSSTGPESDIIVGPTGDATAPSSLISGS